MSGGFISIGSVPLWNDATQCRVACRVNKAHRCNSCQATRHCVMVRVVAAQPDSQSLAVVIGDNCRRIRTTLGVTQNELARYAPDMGLRWTASKAGDFEAGRTSPTLATVLTVTLALQTPLED